MQRHLRAAMVVAVVVELLRKLNLLSFEIIYDGWNFYRWPAREYGRRALLSFPVVQIEERQSFYQITS